MNGILQRLPLGGKLARKRLMRGDQSALAKGIHSPYAHHSPIGREAAPCKKSIPPNRQKNFPQAYPPHTKRNKSLLCMGGCAWGKFSGGQGGLEGRETLSRGLPAPPRSFRCHTSQESRWGTCGEGSERGARRRAGKRQQSESAERPRARTGSRRDVPSAAWREAKAA